MGQKSEGELQKWCWCRLAGTVWDGMDDSSSILELSSTLRPLHFEESASFHTVPSTGTFREKDNFKLISSIWDKF